MMSVQPSAVDMPVERKSLVLGQDEDFAEARVNAVRKRNVDDPVVSAKGHRRLGAVSSKRKEPFAGAACKQNIRVCPSCPYGPAFIALSFRWPQRETYMPLSGTAFSPVTLFHRCTERRRITHPDNARSLSRFTPHSRAASKNSGNRSRFEAALAFSGLSVSKHCRSVSALSAFGFLNLYSTPTEMAKFTSHCVALFPVIDPIVGQQRIGCDAEHPPRRAIEVDVAAQNRRPGASWLG